MGVVVLARKVSLDKKVSLVKYPIRSGALQAGDVERVAAFHARNGRRSR